MAKRRRRIRSEDWNLMYLLWVSLGLVMLHILIRRQHDHVDTPLLAGPVAVLVLVSLLFTFFGAALITWVHEAGHLLAGRLYKFKWLWSGVSGVAFFRIGARLQVHRMDYKFARGRTQMLPSRLQSLRHDLAVYYLAGPVISLLFGSVLLGLAYLYSRDSLPVWVEGVGILGAGSVALAVVEIGEPAPKHPNTDIERYRVLRRKSADAERYASLAYVRAFIAAQGTYKDIHESLILDSLQPMDGTGDEAYANWVAAQYYWENLKYADGIKYLRRSVEVYEGLKQMFWESYGASRSELAYKLAFRNHDLAGAKELLPTEWEPLPHPAAKWTRAAALVARIERRFDDVDKFADLMEANMGSLGTQEREEYQKWLTFLRLSNERARRGETV